MMEPNIVTSNIKSSYTVSKTGFFMQTFALVIFAIIATASLVISLLNYFEIRKEEQFIIKLINTDYTITKDDVNKILKIKENISETYQISVDSIENGRIEVFGSGTDVKFVNIPQEINILTYGNDDKSAGTNYEFYNWVKNTQYYNFTSQRTFTLNNFRAIFYFESYELKAHFYAQDVKNINPPPT